MKHPTPPAHPEPNPICAHEHRTHYLGGGIWVCFECWAKLLCGKSPGDNSAVTRPRCLHEMVYVH